MGTFKKGVVGLLSSALAAVPLADGRAQDPKTPTRGDFVGCWTTTKPDGTMIQTDGSRPDGYAIALEMMMMSVGP